MVPDRCPACFRPDNSERIIMPKLSADTPLLHPDCEISGASFGAFVEIGRGSRISRSVFHDYA